MQHVRRTMLKRAKENDTRKKFVLANRETTELKTFLAALVALIVWSAAAHADSSAPSMSTGSLADNRSHAACLDYSAKVMRVLDMELIRTTQLSVYGQSGDINFVTRCETDAKTVFFAAAGGDNGDKVEGLVQLLMKQFEITKNLAKRNRNSSPLHLCQ